ncbi:MAG: phage portal protein [Ammonifex sp.]|jgi:HK97 family phage portal protein|nr:MAG: phage portal protein [Ammonifex sp.]
MTFLQRLLAAGSLSNTEERFWTDAYSPVTASGMQVSADGALKISTAWACGRLIAETVAMLPRIIYERMDDDAKERATGHPLYSLLHDQPNRKQTAFEFVDMLQMHALFRGNGYAKIIPGVRGPVDKLIPIYPERVTVEEVDEETLRYQVVEKDGSTRTYNDDEIFHLRGLSLDGVEGVSVVRYARESFGLTLAAERFGAKLFANFSRPGGFLKHPKNLSKDAQTRLLEQTERLTGGENVHRMGLLEEGMEWQQVSLAPEDAQFLQTREFQAEDVCRWFRIPPHMVGLTSKTTSWGTGIGELSQGYVTYVLMPWLVRWQQLISKDLIVASGKYFVEFLTEALLRGDIEKRYNAYSVGRQWGWLATNEIRRAENMNPIEGGEDDYMRPLNMQVGSTAGTGGGQGGAEAGTHYERLLQESAGRVARKELAALSRVNRRDGGAEGWERGVEEFFAGHAEFVAETMCIPLETAARFANDGREWLLIYGANGLVGWVEQRSRELVGLVGAANPVGSLTPTLSRGEREFVELEAGWTGNR